MWEQAEQASANFIFKKPQPSAQHHTFKNIHHTPIKMTYTTSPSVSRLLISPSDFLAKYPHIKHLASSALVFRTTDSTHQVLLLQRAPHDSYPLNWEFPGGGVDEDDESLVSAAMRELREETGLEASHVQDLALMTPYEELSEVMKTRLGIVPLDEQVKVDADGTVISFVETGNIWAKPIFITEVKNIEDIKIQDEEHAAFAWVTEDEVRNLQFADGTTLTLVSEGVRRVILDGFRHRREKQ